MRIPQDKIEEVRSATDIVELIGTGVRLRKRGRSYIGLCPFHSEKTPSFTVSPDRQMYHCFGCGAGGNAFTYIMQTEKVSFVEAVRTLASRAGIVIPEGSPADEAAATELELLYHACQEAARFYAASLAEMPEAAIAKDFFRKRGFSAETVRSFGLGYSPSSWSALVTEAASKNITPETLVKAGLARRRDDGTYFDYFHGRAMFPVISHTGRVVGFGARKLRDDDKLGKYINSPETPVYLKSRILYGLYQGREAIRREDHVLLVEGYADCISVFQAGIHNVVASSGTALTREQVQLIRRYASRATIMYDGDDAGARASLRGVDVMLEGDVDIRIAVLPEKHDPDSYVREFGVDAFRSQLDGALSVVDFIAQSYERAGKLETPEGQAQTVRAIVKALAKMKDELKRSFHIRQVAQKYRLYESMLFRELERMMGSREAGEYTPGTPAETTAPAERHASAGRTEVTEAERDLLGAMLDGGPVVIARVLEILTPADTLHPSVREIVEILGDRLGHEESLEPSEIIDQMTNPAHQRLLADVVFSKYQLSRRWEEMDAGAQPGEPAVRALDAIAAIRRKALETRLKETFQRLRHATERGENIQPILAQKQQIEQEIRKLRSEGIKKEG